MNQNSNVPYLRPTPQPQYVSIGGEQVKVPDGMTTDEFFEQYAQYLEETGQGQPQPIEGDHLPRTREYRPFGEVGEDIDPETLKENEDWLTAASMVHQMVERKPFDGTDEELSDWGREHMAFFNYNLMSTGMNTHRVLDADQRTKEAFLYMMDTFDNTKMSWQGTGNAAKAIATDPSNLIGLSTLGLGSVFKFGAQQTAKHTFRQQLVTSAGRAGVIAGVEGGIIGYSDDRMRQTIEVDAGRMEETDRLRSLKATGVGTVAGAVLGTGLDAVASSLGRRFGSSPSQETPNTAQEAPTVTQEPRTTVEVDTVAPTPQAAVEAAPGAEQVAETVTSFPTREVAGFTLPDKPGFIRENTTNAEVREFATLMARQLDSLPPDTTEDSLEGLLRHQLSPTEFSEFQTSVQLASNKLTHELQDVLVRLQTADDELLPVLQKEKGFLSEAQGKMEHLDAILRGNVGRDLQKRKIGETDLNDLSLPKVEQELRETLGLKGHDLQDAVEQEFMRRYSQRMETRAYRKALGELDKQIEDAIIKGDMDQIAKLAVDKSVLNKRLAEDTTKGASIWHKLTEGAISNVFSLKTLAVNLVPSAVKGIITPTIKATTLGWGDKAVRAEAAAAYGAMRTSFRAALRSGLAAWRYEQAIMSHDPNRFLESHLSMGGGKISGKVAPHVRVFLRGINATDEFLTRIFYNAEVSGKAAARAAQEGMDQGLTGRDLDAFIKRHTSEALDRAYRIDNIEVLIDPILRKGQNLGLRGEKLEAYVRKEMSRDPEVMIRAADVEALDHVREILYKRAVSGEGAGVRGFASSMVKGTEDSLNKYPAFKILTGQLFFRTPIRVIEEALRITPGVNWITPGYLADLRGKNGQAKRLRAQGEAMVSFALLAHSMTLWAEGAGRGDGGDKHWQQGRFRSDSHLPDNYTFTDSDGDTFNFRYFDPLATPYKVMFGIYERLDQLKLREAQGEYIGQAEYSRVKDAVLMVAAATVSAVRDANLLVGLNNTYEVGEMLAAGDDRPGAVIKLLGDKVRLLTPNTMHKHASGQDDGMRQMATLEQMVDQQLFKPWGLDFDIKTPYSYDWLGRRRTLTDAGALHNLFSKATPEEREKGRSEPYRDSWRRQTLRGWSHEHFQAICT